MAQHPKPRIGIIIGSTREGRFGDRPAQWIHGLGKQRAELEFELVDLRAYPLPFFNEPDPPGQGPVKDATARRWATLVDRLDGFVVVTPEYNHAPSAVLKNALDYACREFARKPIAFVGYGNVGAARAIEQLRMAAVGLQMVPVRAAVHIGMLEFAGLAREGKDFIDFPHLGESAASLLDHMAWWAMLLTARRRPVEEHDPAAQA